MSIISTEEPRVKLFRMSKSETFEPYAFFSPDYEPQPEFDYQIKITCFGLTVHLNVYVRLGEDDDEDDLMLVMDRPDDTNYFSTFLTAMVWLRRNTVCLKPMVLICAKKSSI